MVHFLIVLLQVEHWESSGDYTIQLRYLEDATEITLKYIVGVN